MAESLSDELWLHVFSFLTPDNVVCPAVCVRACVCVYIYVCVPGIRNKENGLLKGLHIFSDWADKAAYWL